MSTESRKPTVMIWVLDRRDQWHRVSDVAGKLSPPKNQEVERVARYCGKQFEPGVEWSRPIQAGNLVVRIEEKQVVVGLGPESTHRLLINAEMDRALRAWPERRQSRALNGQTEAPSQKADEETTKGGAEKVEPSEPSPFVSVDEVEDVEFEPVQAGLQSLVSLTSDEGGGRDSTSAEARERFADEPRWEEVAAFIASSSEAAGSYLGPTVIANYWRQALRQQGVESLGVKATGALRVQAPDSRLEAEDVAAVQGAYEQWLSRCQRVIPDRQRFQNAVGHPPWEAQSVRPQSRHEQKEKR